jgi:hypothetical protein
VKLFPRQRHLGQADAAETGPPQPVAHLERLPEVLLQSPIPELPEGEVVQRVLGVLGRIPPARVQWHAGGQRPVQQQHRVVMDGVHRRHDAQEPAAGPQHRPHLAQGRFQVADVGQHQAVDGHGHVDRARQAAQVRQAALQERHLLQPRRPAPRPLQHAGGEVHGDHPLEVLRQERQQRTGPAAQVGHGPRPGLRQPAQRRSQRAAHVRPVWVDELLFINRRRPAPRLRLVRHHSTRGKELLVFFRTDVRKRPPIRYYLYRGIGVCPCGAPDADATGSRREGFSFYPVRTSAIMRVGSADETNRLPRPRR